MSSDGSTMSMTGALGRVRWSAERFFYLGFALIMLAAVVLGFARTFFLRPWFAEWAGAHGAPESFFYIKGVVFSAWFVLLGIQPTLVAAGRVDLHRRLGRVGAGLAAIIVVLGVAGALIAARRPTGFIDVTVPPLQFLIVPLTDLSLFGAFVALAVVRRRHAQSHKRYMLLASIGLVSAAVTRWPFAVMTGGFPVPGFGVTDVFVDLFLVPMIVWDFVSRGRLHPVTFWGGLALIASQPLSEMLSRTDGWLAIAGWTVGLLGH